MRILTSVHISITVPIELNVPGGEIGNPLERQFEKVLEFTVCLFYSFSNLNPFLR